MLDLTPIFLRDKQAAAVLGISRSHFWKAFVSTGKIKSHKIAPRITVFKYKDLEALADSLT